MFAKAASYYARAVAIDPQNAQTRTAYAVALHGSGRDEAALRELDTALDRHRDFSPALYAQGVVAQALGRRAVAVAAYKRFLSVAPDDHFQNQKLPWREFGAFQDETPRELPAVGASARPRQRRILPNSRGGLSRERARAASVDKFAEHQGRVVLTWHRVILEDFAMSSLKVR